MACREPKSEYLLRIMQHGSDRAKQLKLADRISNLTALGFVHDAAFVRRYIDETRSYVLPYAEAVNANMFRELSDLVANRELFIKAADGRQVRTGCRQRCGRQAAGASPPIRPVEGQLAQLDTAPACRPASATPAAPPCG
jgi:hypothetical protein